jgi:hypothetical protein
MVEQFGTDPSAHGCGPRGHDHKPPAIAAHGIVPGRNSSLPTRCAVNDAERLDELRTKLSRINGQKEWSVKQEQSALGLVREIVAIEGTDGVAELFP